MLAVPGNTVDINNMTFRTFEDHWL